MKASIKSYHASSGECFGNTHGLPADENTPFRPRSPYGVAKATAFWQVANYREAYNLLACSGILYNHESPLRPERFVTQKIVSAACRIANGSEEKLHLGNVDVIRDWGWAPEYVESMYLMLQQEELMDYVIATGKSYSLADFVAQAFECVGLDWQDHVVTDASLYRPTDITWGGGNPRLAEDKLGWRPKYKMPDVVKMMVRKTNK